jgi:hypothetical protein
MNITLNIQAGNPGELQEAIAGLAGIVGGSVDSQPKLEKAKKGNRGTTKPTEQPDSKPEETPEEVTNSDKTDQLDANPETTSETAVDGGSDSENIPTVVELRAKAQEKGQTPEDKKKIKALLDEFEAKSISDLPEEKRAAFLRKLEALNATGTC